MDTQTYSARLREEYPTAHAYSIAADCASPDSAESPGAQFLAHVMDAVCEMVDDEDRDEWQDRVHEIADQAIPIYTHERWMTFADLAAYNEDVTELGPIEDMTDAAGVALYMIAERMAHTLLAEVEEMIDVAADNADGD